MKFLKKCLCFALVLLSLVSYITVAPESHTHAASASDYISQSYASSLSVKTTKTVSLMSFPTTASGSVAKYTLPKDTVLTVKALHKNNDGKYFYEVLYYNLTLYVDATATTMLDHLTGDVTFTNGYSPSSLTLGNGFPIQGNIKSTLNNIGKVTAAMYNGTNLTRIPAISSSDTVNGKSYNLTNSTVDKNLIFSDLPKGSYSYVVTAEAVSYYVDNSGALKTSVTPIVLENQICAVTNGSSPNPVLHNGIDVSVWNGNIDWAKVKTQVDFAILRASWEETADTKFTTNANGCRDNGIPFGVYVYSYAENAAEAIGEAEYVLSLVDGYDMDLPIFFDFEDECQMNLTAAKQQEIVKAFCDTIYAGGRQPGLYTYVWLLRSVFTDTYYKTIPIWTAEINGSSYTSYKGGLWLWQWSWVGRFDGMSGDVDCNKMYVDLPDKNKSDTSYLSKCTYYPSNLNVTTTQSCNLRQYPSTDYSILTTLPSGANVHITGLYKNAYGNYWYQAEYGGKTGYIDSNYVTINEYLYSDIAIANPKMASNLAVGKGFYIEGELSSIYNQLSTVNAKIYAGENTLATPTLKSSYNVNKKDYNLYKSNVDYGLNFGLLSEGYYTYEVSADVKNYYISGGTLTSKTENVVVWKSPLTIGNATITPPESNVCVHNIVTEEGKLPTCTEAGYTMSSKCTLCGEVVAKKETISATGHDYVVKLIEATCVTTAHNLYTCSNCQNQYKEYLDEGEWLETPPEGVSASQLETKTQYRTSTYKEVKNYEASISNGTQVKKEWEDAGNTTITYAKSWPAGFNTSNSFYSKYNIKPKTNSESGNTKYQIVTAEKTAGAWVYWHWCRNYQYGPINRTTSLVRTDEYHTFHAFYSTDDPATKSKGNATDGSVIFENAAACKDAYWFYNVPLYTQTYKTYKALYTHATWSDWSEWSDTPATATDKLRVETREVYRVKALGDHRFSRGRCLVCDYVCTHKWEDGKCEFCLMSCMHRWSNGQCTICNQPCVHSWQNGVCTNCGTVCVQHEWCEGICDNCGLGCAHNWEEGGCTICGHNCYPHVYIDGKCGICSVPCPGHIWSGDTCEICFMTCEHQWVDGECQICESICTHNWKNGVCSFCGEECVHNFENGKCTKCEYICRHNFTDGVCSDCSAICTHNWHNGICTACSMKCNHSWQNGMCENCKMICQHTFRNGVCTICTFECTHSWKNGVCKVCNSVCKHNFEDGKCTICAKECKHAFYDGKCQICKLPCTHNFIDSVCTLCKKECMHEWNLGICTLCEAKCEHNFAQGYCRICLSDCSHTFANGACTICYKVCDPHNFKDGMCIICETAEPEYYLVGYINGAEYGMGEDADNIGTYKFTDGELKVKFTEDSFVFIKTGDNAHQYMTNTYLGDKVNTAILYKSELLGDKADKLFVPKGREITFTLVDNNDSTFTLSYVAKVCEHKLHSIDGSCTDCGVKVEHTYFLGECTVCETPCEHLYKNGRCTVCTAICQHNFIDDVCTICSFVCTHSFIDGICVTCQKECPHSFIEGGCTICGMRCKHQFNNGKCSVCDYICYHSFTDGICTECSKECDHIWKDGICKYCSLVCIHSYKDGVCSKCSYQCEHTYNKEICTNCQIAKYYLVGYINNETVGFNENHLELGRYALTDGSITVNVKHDSYFFVKTSDNKNWYMATDETVGMFALLENTALGEASEMIFIPGGVTAEFSVYAGKNDTVGFIYTIEKCIHKFHTADGICLACEEQIDHTYSQGLCTGCMSPKPEQDMYLFGVINGKDYGYNYDSENIGEYLFVDKTLTVKFTEDSYIGIKSADNRDWYMTDGKLAEGIQTAVLSNTCEGIDAELLFIPADTEVRITIINNGNDTFTLTYKSTAIPDCELKIKYAELITDNEFRYKVAFTAEGLEDFSVNDMGLLMFERNVAQPTIEYAEKVIDGARIEGNYIVVETDVIEAQKLVDTIFFRAYAKVDENTYVYSDIVSYSAVRYATSVINSKYAPASEKAQMTALLNFIAAAQKYHGYKTENLANAGLAK